MYIFVIFYIYIVIFNQNIHTRIISVFNSEKCSEISLSDKFKFPFYHTGFLDNASLYKK